MSANETNDKLMKLHDEFPPEAVHWRVQGTPYERDGKFKAMALAYIDARDVMDRLDKVCGPAGWQTEYVETSSGRVICRIGVRVGDEWVWKADGDGKTAVEGEKGGISDSLKRAAVAWGVGRYLYRLDSPWVRCIVKTKDGRNYWQRWDEDPWKLVKRTAFVPPAPTEAEDVETEPAKPEPNLDHASTRDRIIAAIGRSESLAGLDKLMKHPATKKAYSSLPREMFDVILDVEKSARIDLEDAAMARTG